MADLVQILARDESLAERPVQPEVILGEIVKDSDPLRHNDHRRKGEHGHPGPSCTSRSPGDRAISPRHFRPRYPPMGRNIVWSTGHTDWRVAAPRTPTEASCDFRLRNSAPVVAGDVTNVVESALSPFGQTACLSQRNYRLPFAPDDGHAAWSDSDPRAHFSGRDRKAVTTYIQQCYDGPGWSLKKRASGSALIRIL